MSVNRDSVQALLAGHCTDRMVKLEEEFQARARGRSARRTGELADSILIDDPVVTATSIAGRVHTESEYAQYQDEGTGIFGPRGERIVPDQGQALRFDWPVADGVVFFASPVADGVVFFASVAGTEPTRFWTATVEEWGDIVRAS